MSVRPPEHPWKVVGRSVRGAMHVRKGLPNQDAFAIVPSSDAAPLVVAVADGHGSPKSFRSDRGAAFAVRAAAEVLGASTPADREDRVRLLVAAWRDLVDADLAREPLPEPVGPLPRLAYGSTLLAAAVYPSGVWLAQLGDGDILAVDADQAVRPVAGDASLIGNETTSLCMPEAASSFRTAWLPSAPALLMMSTDGYCNSYRDDTAFLQTGPDLVRMIRAEGMGPVERNLESWLDESSRLGSGDDVTLAVVYFTGKAAPARPTPVASRKGTVLAPRRRGWIVGGAMGLVAMGSLFGLFRPASSEPPPPPEGVGMAPRSPVAVRPWTATIELRPPFSRPVFAVGIQRKGDTWNVVASDGILEQRWAVAGARVVLQGISRADAATLDRQRAASEIVSLRRVSKGVELRIRGDGTARENHALLTASDDDVRCFAPSPDGQLAVTGHEDGRVRLWGRPRPVAEDPEDD